ncbi:MAG: TonB-dependent receptor, partial [Acidobacteriota bacterium]
MFSNTRFSYRPPATSAQNAARPLGWFGMLVIISALLTLMPVLTSAQAVSGVTGVVSDAAGAIVPGATVTLTDTKTSKELTTKTNDQGVYSFNNVSPGDGYKIAFTLSGFQTLTISDITLGVGRTETHDATLAAGQVTENVEVSSSNDVTLNTTDPSIGNVINTRQLRELPIQIRSSPAALIGLQAGVVGNNVGTGSTNRVGSVTGSRADQGNITVDGIDANDQATGQFAATVGNAPIDAIQEFRAVTVNPSASEGRSSGGQVQLVTKSGTNDFHGSLREYNRNEKFAANSFFNNRSGIRRPKLNRNQFGGNLGGPLPLPNFGDTGPGGSIFKSGKDRLFFFFDYEGRRDAQEVSYSRTVPLAHFRNGGLAYISGPAASCSGARLNTNPSCITILTAAQVRSLDPLGIGANSALLSVLNSRYPLPNDLTLGDGLNTGGFRFNAPSSRKDNTYTTRFDANINDNQKAFVRFNIARRNQTDTVNSVAAQFPGDPTAALIVVEDYSIAFGHSWAITNSLFNQLTIGNSHSGLGFPNDFRPAFPNEFTFSTLSAPFAGIDTQSRVVNTPTIRDDATWTNGSHTLFFGVQFKPIKSVSGLVNDFNTISVGLGGNLDELDDTLRPDNISSAGLTQFDASFPFLLGRFGQLNTNYTYGTNGLANAPGTGKIRDFRYNEYEYYVQDNWKVRNDLTINLGLRYQYYSPPYEKNGFQAGNDVDLDQLFATRVANGAAGIGGDAAEPFLTYSLIGKGNDARPYYKGDKNNLAPRVGFAYSPSFSDGFMKSVFGDRKTSIRGGAAIVYERVGGALTFIQDQLSYLFDNSANTSFGGIDARSSLIDDPRFTGLTSLPVNNVAPVITNPNTPFVDGGV